MLPAQTKRDAITRTAAVAAGREAEQGFLLLALVVVIFLIALFATLAAPTVARELERDKELESEHRAQQYIRAIQLYYRKNHAYPNSIDQLLGTGGQGSVTAGPGTQHYLREQYKDPLTGGDYRLIHQGEQKTEVKGFFGEPLEGFAQGSLGSIAGQASGIGTGLGGQSGLVGGLNGNGSSGSSGSGSSPFGNSFSSGAGSSSASAGSGAAGAGTTTGANSAGGSGGSSTTDTGSTLGGTSATSFQGSKGFIVGVGSSKSGAGIVEWNGSANIEDWEFLYDPRIEIMKQKVSLFGGTPAESGTGSLGTAGGSTNGLGSNTPSFGGNPGGSGGGFGGATGGFSTPGNSSAPPAGSSSGTQGSSGASATPQ